MHRIAFPGFGSAMFVGVGIRHFGHFGKLMVHGVRNPLHLLSRRLDRAVLVTMPFICACFRRNKVSPVGNTQPTPEVRKRPRVDSVVSSLALPALEGAVTRYTFGSFELCARDDAAKTATTPSVPVENDVSSGSDVTAGSKRPLVIMFPWLNARQSTVYKYGSLYLQRGMDVLTMKVTPMQIIRPMQTKRVVGELMDLLQDRNGPLADRPLLVHGFSIGAFVWGQLLVELDRLKQTYGSMDTMTGNTQVTLREKPYSSAPELRVASPEEAPREPVKFQLDEEWTTVDLSNDGKATTSDTSWTEQGSYDQRKEGPTGRQGADGDNSNMDKSSNSCVSTLTDIQKRIVGVVMDSPTPFENILEGIPKSISDNTLVTSAIRALFSTYMRVFRTSVTEHYIQGAQAAESNKAGLPTLMLYSSADNIVSSDKLDTVVAEWQKKGHFVRCRKWEDTPHVGHFRLHPNEYTQEVQEFIEYLRLSESKL